MLVTVGGDDVLFVRAKEEGIQEGRVSEDELATGRVLVRCQGVTLWLFLVLTFVGWRWSIVERIAVGAGNRCEREGRKKS